MVCPIRQQTLLKLRVCLVCHRQMFRMEQDLWLAKMK